MAQEKILFLVHTEYHMMVTLSVIADKYFDSEKYHVTIFQSEYGGTKRFKFEKSLAMIPDVAYHTIKYDERDFKYNEELNKAVNTILNNKYDVFVMFNHHAFLPVFLAKKLYKKGTKVCLAPDGAKAYNDIQKFTPRWSLKAAIEFQRFLIANKLYLFDIHIPTLPYANLKEIDEVWLPHLNSYNNYNNKKLTQIGILSTTESKELVNDYFQFNGEEEIYVKDKVIFYINQPVRDNRIYNYELELLNYLQNRFPDYSLVLKLHPLTEPHQLEKLKNLPKTTIITKSFPAEIYIANLVDSIILSFWSTACLINNPNVTLYWLHPVLQCKGIMPNYINISNPTDHINEVSNMEEVKAEFAVDA